MMLAEGLLLLAMITIPLAWLFNLDRKMPDSQWETPPEEDERDWEG